MKLMNTALVALGLAVSYVQAVPATVGGLTLYKLKASNDSMFAGRYLALRNNIVGLYEDDASPVQVYQSNSQKPGCKELHTFPIGIVDHSLGLVGQPGFLSFTDMVNPEGLKPGVVKPGDSNDEADVFYWNTFVVDNHHMLTDSSPGLWRAYPSTGDNFGDGNWEVKWVSGDMITTEDYMPIRIEMEAAGNGQYSR
ncbi:hypothetical protein F5Y18DRAFT_432020 [Xylariaceae sp. FL1019]|nr:hypothetical protein F5Y18DRAFT_432020 [Xylariaceae sp. FL1019]